MRLLQFKLSSQTETPVLMTLLAFLALSWSATPAAAQNYVTWWSNTGTDSTGCGDTDTPCKTPYYAIGRTIAGGEVICKDISSSDLITISKSITFTCDGARNTSGSTATNYALDVTIGPADTVTIRGLNFEGSEINYGSHGGLNFTGSGTLVLDNVKVTGWRPTGVYFAPNGPGKLVVTNSIFARNGNQTNGTGAAIRVVPQGTGSARVHIDRVTVANNAFGRT